MQLESLKNAALNRISKIVDEVFENSEVYREQIDKAKFMEHLSNRIENGLAPEKAISVADDRLTRIVRQHMAIELLGNLSDGLTPEEIRIFNEAVEGG